MDAKAPECKFRVAASVHVYDVPLMTTVGRKSVCDWLRKLADDLQDEPEIFAVAFRARYWYPVKDEGEEVSTVAKKAKKAKKAGGKKC